MAVSGAGSPGRRRWRSVSLRGLIVLVLLVGSGSGWVVQRARVQREAVAAIEAVGGQVFYSWDYDFESDHPAPDMSVLGWRQRLSEWIGPDFVGYPAAIHLTGLKDSEQADALMVHVGRLRGLRSLSLNGTGVTDRGFRELVRLVEVRRLSVGFNPGITSRSMRVVEGMRRLRAVNNTTIPMTDADLATFGRCADLEELEIASPGIGDAGVAHLVGLKRLTYLALLGDCEVGQAGLARIGEIRSLRALTLTKSNVSDLRPIAGLSGLERLMVIDAPLDDEGVSALAGLARLQTLSIPNSRVGDEGLAALRGLKRLTDVDLAGTAIGDDGLRNLAGPGGLLHLRLERTGVGDAGLAHLAGIQKLRLIFLDETQVTDVGLWHLVGLKRCMQVTAKGTAVTAEGAAAFMKVRPDCRVIR